MLLLYVEMLVLQVSSWHVGIKLLIEEVEKIDKYLNPSSSLSCFPVPEVSGKSGGVQPNQTVNIHLSSLERLAELVPSPGKPPDDAIHKGSDLPDMNVGQVATNKFELIKVTGQCRVIEDNMCSNSQIQHHEEHRPDFLPFTSAKDLSDIGSSNVIDTSNIVCENTLPSSIVSENCSPSESLQG